MENKNITIASEIIAAQENRLKTIISELGSTVDDLLEKSKFILTELMDLVDEKPEDINDTCVFASNQRRINMLVNIAFDYLHQAQVRIGEIVTREQK